MTSGQPYWCRLCATRFKHFGGELPKTCPECEQAGHWSTEEVVKFDDRLTANDRRFLKSIRVAANNDHDSDGA